MVSMSFRIGLGIFLSAAEITIMSTSLVTITDELMHYEQGSWLITAYLLAFTGFLTLWAKCTDVFGLKASLLSSLLIFVAFSGGCGAVRTMNQLSVDLLLRYSLVNPSLY
jgi:MFS family permease